MYKIYESISMLEKLVGVFGTVAINVNYATTFHFDFDDFANDFCWILSFGHYDGGNLNFLPLNMKAILKSGNFIAFKSRQIDMVMNIILETNFLWYFLSIIKCFLTVKSK
jgi:hypothetical protein